MADEKPAVLFRDEVPRPALFGWSIFLIIAAIIIWLLATAANDPMLSGSAIALEGVGWLLFAAACVVHTLRVEGEATRRSVGILHGGATKYTLKHEGTILSYWESGKHRSAIYIHKNPIAFSSLSAAKEFVESNRT